MIFNIMALRKNKMVYNKSFEVDDINEINFNYFEDINKRYGTLYLNVYDVDYNKIITSEFKNYVDCIKFILGYVSGTNRVIYEKLENDEDETYYVCFLGTGYSVYLNEYDEDNNIVTWIELNSECEWEIIETNNSNYKSGQTLTEEDEDKFIFL